MSNAQSVLDHLNEAARLLALAKDNPEFSTIIEGIVARAQNSSSDELETNIVCSMLYAAREAVEMKR